MNKILKFCLKNISLLVILLYFCGALVHRNNTEVYKGSPGLLQYDMTGYYSFLQAFFINGDYAFHFYDTKPHQSFIIDIENSEGEISRLNKYNVGPAILSTPFFLLGHLESYIQKVPRDGFSYTYQYWVLTGVIFYIFLALLLLRKVLLRYFEDRAIASTLLVLAIGTNLWHYTVYSAMMSHAFSFFLFSLSVYLALQWFDSGKLSALLGLALTCGLIGVTRLPNMVFFLVPIFWGIYDWNSLKERFVFFGKKWKGILIGLFVFLIPFIPQVAYWYHVTGYFLVNSYGDNGEKIYWLQPMIAEVLIGYRKGWFIYSPAIILGFIGFYHLFKQQKKITWILFLYLMLNIYVVSSWSCWWYGGSFGMRALIESSLVLAFPIAALFQAAYQYKLKSAIINIVALALIALNLLQSHQSYHLIMHYDAMSRKAYWTIFCKLPPIDPKVIKKYKEELIHPDVLEESRRRKYVQTIW